MAARTSFQFPKKAMAELRAIKERARLNDTADVIRIALQAYEEMLDLYDGHQRMFIVDPHNRKQEWEYSPYRQCAYPGFGEMCSEDIETKKDAPGTFFFSGEAAKSLASIRSRSYANSNSDAIRLALTAYKELVLADEAGCSIVVRDGKGGEVAYNPYRPFRRTTSEVETSQATIA
jgi:Arc/MetJ-type ribon-helix-helix transcriptional regulator